MSLIITKPYYFKVIATGESVAMTYPGNLTVCEFLHKITNVFKEKYNITDFTLIEAGTELAENGRRINFNDYPTRLTNIQQLFENINTFYVQNVTN